MSSQESAAAELKLSQLKDTEAAAKMVLEAIESIPGSSRHLSIARAGMENVIYRLRDERRVTAGPLMAAGLASPEDLP